jgi:hypothetical protein
VLPFGQPATFASTTFFFGAKKSEMEGLALEAVEVVSVVETEQLFMLSSNDFGRSRG